MYKLVFIRLFQEINHTQYGRTDRFKQGFFVILQIHEDRNHSIFTEIIGELPPDDSISSCYYRWQSVYHALQAYRLEKSATQMTNYSDIEVNEIGQELKTHFNSWLNSKQFRPIREKLLEKLDPDDEVRVIIQTENRILRRLPWHLWDLFERYPKAEVALSKLACDRVTKTVTPRSKVRILAILGNRTGIDIDKDKQFLESITNAETVFLVEPERQKLDAQLWDERGWDILFFAGHSSSQLDATTGCIYLNSTESLTIPELKYALKKAIERGLKLAIFNSCDGLGIGWELAELNIPQVIVMREPVPDLVAQAFLKHFLKAYSRGKSLYTSVREAREKLHGMEGDFPYASWLPVICQNPAEIEIEIGISNREQVLAEIRKKLLVTSNLRELKEVLYMVEHFLMLHPNDVEGRLLRDQVIQAISNQQLRAYSSRTSKYLVIFIIALLITLVFIAIALKGSNLSRFEKLLNSLITNNGRREENWLFYIQSELGIKIIYPEYWTKQNIEDPVRQEVVKFISPSTNGLVKQELIINVEDLEAQSFTLEEYSRKSISEIKQHIENGKILESHATTLSNRPAFMVVFTGKDGNQTFKTMQVWTLNKNRAYIITYRAEENKYANNLEIAKKMIESFEIISPQALD